jgi:RNA polymerase sigma-70 factor, ECF subfamily
VIRGDGAGQVTGILSELAGGNSEAWPKLVQIVYRDLRRIAGAQINREHPGQTLQPTELVHEAYLRLSAYRKKNWESRTHFFAAASQVMRRVLVERARRRIRRGACGDPNLTANLFGTRLNGVNLLDLDRALIELAAIEPRLARIVELRYFGGLTVEEAAEVLSISAKTVKRDWAVARSFLYGRLQQQ